MSPAAILLLVSAFGCYHLAAGAKEVKTGATLSKRGNQGPYYIEVLPIYSYDLYQSFRKLSVTDAEAINKIRVNCVQMMHAMREIYQKSNTNIEIAIVSCWVFQTTQENACMEKGRKNTKGPSGRVGHDASKSLTACSEWSNKYSGKKLPTGGVLPKADHYMFLTKEDLWASDAAYGLLGLAWLSGVCTNLRASVVEDNGIHATSMVAAHELGHNLGSKHDGSAAASGCAEFLLNEMSPVSNPSGKNYAENAMTFSQCSKDMMWANLNTKDCVKNKPKLGKYSTYEKPLAGKKLSFDDQCKIATNYKDSVYCGGQKMLEGICTMMLCKGRDGKCNLQKLADQGTVCGDKKRCHNNKCVASSDGVSVKDCQYGDSHVEINFNGMVQTCKQLVAQTGYCANNFVQEYCCASCAELSKQFPADCPNGDGAAWCKTLTPSQCYANDKVCCATCAKFRNGPKNCVYGDKANGCESVKQSTYLCYQNKENCCNTCNAYKTNIANCEYGDRSNWCANNLSGSSDPNCKLNKKLCCKTCQ